MVLTLEHVHQLSEGVDCCRGCGGVGPMLVPQPGLGAVYQGEGEVLPDGHRTHVEDQREHRHLQQLLGGGLGLLLGHHVARVLGHALPHVGLACLHC